LLGELGVAAGQFPETGMALDGLRDERQFLRANALAVVLSILVALQQVIGAMSEEASSALALIDLLAEMAADHGVDAGHFLEDLSSFLLERGC
jgi:hypothetical protein